MKTKTATTQKPIISIDTNKWETVKAASKRLKLPLGTLCQRIARTRQGTTLMPVDIWEIPELSLVLVSTSYS